jgi:hypothetical protein
VYKVQPVNSTNYASFINRLFVRRKSNYVPVKYIYATEDKFAKFREQKLDVTDNKVFNQMLLDNEIFYI